MRSRNSRNAARTSRVPRDVDSENDEEQETIAKIYKFIQQSQEKNLEGSIPQPQKQEDPPEPFDIAEESQESEQVSAHESQVAEES